MEDKLVELNLGLSSLAPWVFVAEMVAEFIQGLDVLKSATHRWTWRHTLRMGQEEVSVRRPGARL